MSTAGPTTLATVGPHILLTSPALLLSHPRRHRPFDVVEIAGTSTAGHPDVLSITTAASVGELAVVSPCLSSGSGLSVPCYRSDVESGTSSVVVSNPLVGPLVSNDEPKEEGE